jgi:low affinity Fe/Cu permease
VNHVLDRLSVRASAAMEMPQAILAVVGFSLLCHMLAPVIGWMMAQVILTTTLTVLTLVTAMLIQRGQSRSEHAMQLKLDELIRASEGADNQFRGIEQEDL